MKRLMLLFLCLALVFPMAACDSDDNGGDAEKKFDPGYIVASSLDVTGKTATDDADGSHTGYKLEQFVEEATLDSLLDREDKVDPTDAGTDLFALFHYCAVASDFEPKDSSNFTGNLPWDEFKVAYYLYETDSTGVVVNKIYGTGLPGFQQVKSPEKIKGYRVITVVSPDHGTTVVKVRELTPEKITYNKVKDGTTTYSDIYAYKLQQLFDKAGITNHANYEYTMTGIDGFMRTVDDWDKMKDAYYIPTHDGDNPKSDRILVIQNGEAVNGTNASFVTSIRLTAK